MVHPSHPHYPKPESAALDFSLAASQVPNGLNDKIKTRLYQHWNEGENVEMLGVILLFGYLIAGLTLWESIEDAVVKVDCNTYKVLEKEETL